MSFFNKFISYHINHSFSPQIFDDKIGLEKEGLRVNNDGEVSQNKHPVSLGSALCNPYITTDYGEALLELVTPPCNGVTASLNWLLDISAFCLQNNQQDLIFAGSMPPRINEDQIIIAQYGKSNIAQIKTIYRRGLQLRYGKRMQSIAGIHFNFSFSQEFWKAFFNYQAVHNKQQNINDAYFAIMRNYQRLTWLIYYLFGATPAFDKSFTENSTEYLKEHLQHSIYSPYATCLRMSNFGYSSPAQSQINNCYNGIKSYIDKIKHALTHPYPAYAKLGLKKNNRYQQLNTNLLQIENELYSNIRPKAIQNSGERPLIALSKRGVSYLEVRNIDNNLFEPCGISHEQLTFMRCFMYYCILLDSPPLSEEENQATKDNALNTSIYGLSKSVTLKRDGKEIPLKVWGQEVLTQMLEVAKLLDKNTDRNTNQSAVITQLNKIKQNRPTPSSLILQKIQNNKIEYHDLVVQFSKQHQKHLLKHKIEKHRYDKLKEAAVRSLSEQKSRDRGIEKPLDEFIQEYINQC